MNTISMKHFFLIISIFTVSIFKAQCFQIQSILVDACAGSQEGQNEMVTFQVGSLPLLAANLSVTWPNNGWLGLTQNAGTAADVAVVNATILGCGFLKEPIAGVLPANSKVLLVTSTTWSPLAQSFANLTDTLIVLFQTAGNTSGHFANYASGGGTRTLTMNFSLPIGCTDAVTYDRALLVNQTGNVGGQDGGTVQFTPAGVASYVNPGCQAPFIPLSVDAGPIKTVCSNASQTFTGTTSGSYTSLQWSTSPGATGSFSPTNSLTTTYMPGASDNGTIKLYFTAFRACGSQTVSTKDSVNLTVTPLPTVTVSPTSISICAGQSATVLANTNTSVTYTWSTGVNTNTASLSAAGNYTVNVSNACGGSSSTVSVSLLSAPTLSVASASPSICASGQTTTLSLSGSAGSYIWNTGATTSTVLINSPGVYTATVSSGSCGSATTSINVGSAPMPTVSISATTSTICAGGATILTANSNTTNYLWSNGVTTQTVSSGSVSITVTSTNACGSSLTTQTLSIIPVPTVTVTPNPITLCAGQVVTLQANVNTPVTYTWSTTANTSSVSVSTAGIYTVSVSNVCGSALTTATINVGGSAPTITLTSTSMVLCSGQTATITASGSTGSYIWSNGANTSGISINTPGVYTATVMNTCGFTTASIQINGTPSATVQITTNNSALCPSATAILTAVGSASNYTWSTGANTSTIQVNSTGVYSVVVSNGCGIGSNTILILPLSVPQLSLSTSHYTLCPGQTATLSVTGGNAPYTWSNSANTGSTVTSSGGIVSVNSSNACGTDTETISITTVTLSAAISGNPVIGTVPLTVNLVNNSVGAGQVNWNFGNGFSATTQSVSPQTYTAVGTYTVFYNVTNGPCVASTDIVITVLNEGSSLYIPNAFTPNGDHVNDIFYVGATNITDFNMVIFDRWGLEMFSSSDIKAGWDGKVKNVMVSDGTYFYLITAKDLDNNKIDKQGHVTLFK